MKNDKRTNYVVSRLWFVIKLSILFFSKDKSKEIKSCDALSVQKHVKPRTTLFEGFTILTPKYLIVSLGRNGFGGGPNPR